jgi:hypothetical protein
MMATSSDGTKSRPAHRSRDAGLDEIAWLFGRVDIGA